MALLRIRISGELIRWSPAAVRPTFKTGNLRARFVARPVGSGSDKQTEKAEEPEGEEPIWARREKLRELQEEEASGKFELPFYVSLLLSGIIAIAAVGSVFEYINKNPVFGVIQPDSPLWAPILGFFALTGLPVSGILFFNSVATANKISEQMDRIDKA